MKSVIRIDENSSKSAISNVKDTVPYQDAFSSPADDGAIKLDVYDKSQRMNSEVRSILELYQQLLNLHTDIARETVDTMVETDITLSKYITSEERGQ